MRYKPSIETVEKITFIQDGTAIICKMSPLTGQFHKALMLVTEEQYYRWAMHRVPIQNAMPNLSPEEREFILTGYTPEDWAVMFPPEEEEE